MGGIDSARLVFLDACGVLTNMVRRHGRNPCGARACASAPFGHWTRVMVLGALGSEGIVGAMSVEAATSAPVFHTDLGEVLLPELRRNRLDAVVIMDNLSAHKAPHVRALLDASGFSDRLLPTYSPDLSPRGPRQGRAAPGRRTHRRCAARGTRPGAGQCHRPGRGRVLPPLRLQPSQVTCKVL